MNERGIDRRDALKFAAAAATLSAGTLAAASARAQGSSTPATPPAGDTATEPMASPGWYRMTIGEATVTTILDGKRPGDGPHPTFGADQPAETVAELLEANFLPTTRFVNGFTPVLIETGGELVLFDTGLGAMGRGNGMGRLVEVMAEAGYAPEDVDIVVLTHFHGDHIGGLMEESGPTFANARYFAGQVEYDFWTSEEAKTGPRADGAALVAKNVVPLAEKITFIAEGDEIVPGLVAHEAFGHSPGHMVFHMTSGEAQLWLTADTSNHYVASLQRPEWQVAFDQDKAMAIETRRQVFDKVAADRVPFIGYHMPFPSVGYAEKTEEGYRFVPLSYQLDV